MNRAVLRKKSEDIFEMAFHPSIQTIKRGVQMFYISGFYDEVSGKLSEQLRVLQALGGRYLCPRGINGKNIAAYTAAQFTQQVQPQLEEAGVQISSLGSPIGKIAINDDKAYARQLEQLRHLVQIAQSTGCRYIRCFSFFVPQKEDSQRYHGPVAEKLHGFLRVVEGSGITLLHENEKKIYGDIPERVLALTRELGHEQFRLCYDASNYLQCGVDAWEAYEKTKEHTVYYHMKDCINGVEVPLGIGDGAIRKILSDLHKAGYNGFVTLEPHTQTYALTKRVFALLPGLSLTGRGRVYRKIDKEMQAGRFTRVSREAVFIRQHKNLTQILTEIGAQYT